MLLVPCPYCGPRSEGEFTYGGARRPLPPLDADISIWRDVLYTENNPRDRLVELWHHTSGCEIWVEITRDTTSHRILSTRVPQPEAGTS